MRLIRLRQALNSHRLLKSLIFPVLLVRRRFQSAYVNRRQINDALGRVFRNTVVLTVQEFEGTFWVAPTSDIFRRLVINGHYEPCLAELCRTLIDPRRDVIDVGANIGFFTVLSAKYTSGKVCAIEPTENALGMLRKNVAENGVGKKVLIFEGAVSDKSGEASIELIEGMEEYSSICGITHPTAVGQLRRNKIVECTTLADLVQKEKLNPGLIKLDVEGAEGKVLSKAWSVVEEFRPILLSEFSPQLFERSGENWKMILSKLKQYRYRLMDPLMPDVAPGTRRLGDLLAVPEEKYSYSELRQLVSQAINLGH